MADYWKSQPKKFCDFCKCWIADNRPSVDFHEKGKRHKENVEKRLKEMTKQSCKDHKSNLKVEDQMKKMEEAAMRAYMKDVEENRDLSSLLIKEELTKRDQVVKRESEATSSLVKETQPEEAKVDVKEEKAILWQEALSDEGHVYYWHVETGEAIWETPADGFLSLAQKRATEEKKQAELESQRKEELKARADEERARLAREKMKKRAVKKEEKKIVPFDPVEMGPAPRKDPYGAWKAVEKWTSEPVDLQLPRSNHETVAVRVATISNIEPKIRFKEKTLDCVKSEYDNKSATDFKKRKGNSNMKRNTRQRLDDDD